MAPDELPRIGFGTLRIGDSTEVVETVSQAIEVGYRHIDNAQKYDNQEAVGDGIAEADIPREQLFIASKVNESNLAYEDVLETTRETRDALGVDTIDLHYVHWPAISGEEDRYDPEETIPAFNELLKEGVIDRVGVANFDVDLIEEAQMLFDAPIFANQVEMHPLLQQEELVVYAQENDMYLVAYSPLIRGEVDEIPDLREIARKYDATPAQVSLAWLMSIDNVVPIPKATGDHIRENYHALDLKLDPEDIDRIESIERERRIVDRGKGPWQW
ncbi:MULTISPECIES: aldo/keto reductase [Haloferacaceae]|uniref:Aldo/keto reductase n=1 Tax=Halorubrum glutamatedens TaxID=2707018 RepID=A0ABD5QMY9_9EURY|nr:aldo/keto reductase [Halobellus captivus]